MQKASELLLNNAGNEGDASKSQIIATLATQMEKQLTQIQLSQFTEYQADNLGLQFIDGLRKSFELKI
jgi:hypothetical protein